MGRKKPPESASAKTLTPEDRALWQDVAVSIEPLEAQLRSGERDHSPETAAPEAPPRPPRQKRTVAPDNLIAKRAVKPPPSAVPGKIDRRAQRQIARGKTPIDSTLDLHGMTQQQAFLRLSSHIEQASAAGQRCILVITGKGARQNAGADAGSGVLRRNLPDWLGNQALSGLVSGIAPAGRSHGGDGAFYVRLKKQK